MSYQHFLQKIYQHPQINEKELAEIVSKHQRVHFKKGEFLLKEGQHSKSYYCLESGLIRAFATSSEGKEVTTGFFCPEEIVIEVASLFLNEPTKENLQALTDSVCWKIPLSDFQILFSTINGFTEWGRTWMSRALFITKQRSLAMITASARDRYLDLLTKQPDILHQAPLKHIASYLGITDTSLSRIRKELNNPQ